MGLVEFATNPWGQTVPIHIFFYLMWVAAIGGLAFLMVHAIYVQFVAAKQGHGARIDPALAAKYPAKVLPELLALLPLRGEQVLPDRRRLLARTDEPRSQPPPRPLPPLSARRSRASSP